MIPLRKLIDNHLAEDNEMKYDNLARSLAMMEDELKRADERVKNAESRVVVIEDELQAIGENQKQLESLEAMSRGRNQLCLTSARMRSS